jgi:hypothetical protein
MESFLFGVGGASIVWGISLWWRGRRTKTAPPDPDAIPYQVRTPGGEIHKFPRTPEGYQLARAKRRETHGWLFTQGDAHKGRPRR